MMKFNPFLFFACAMLLSLRADEHVFSNSGTVSTLVELYSSEGCSSCPPAEEWVSTLMESPRLWKDIFPVVFHVDYWDGLGWPDRFARAEYTQRQRAYAARLGQDSVYTPEFVVGGHEWRQWFHGDRQPRSTSATSGELTLTVNDHGRHASANYSGIKGQALTINYALLGMKIMSDVRGGENSGRQLQHDFVVLAFKSAPLTAGGENSVELPSATKEASGAVVAWVSTSDGAILQVTGGALN